MKLTTVLFIYLFALTSSFANCPKKIQINFSGVEFDSVDEENFINNGKVELKSTFRGKKTCSYANKASKLKIKFKKQGKKRIISLVKSIPVTYEGDEDTSEIKEFISVFKKIGISKNIVPKQLSNLVILKELTYYYSCGPWLECSGYEYHEQEIGKIRNLKIKY